MTDRFRGAQTPEQRESNSAGQSEHKQKALKTVQWAPGSFPTVDGHPNPKGPLKPKRDLGLYRFVENLTKRSVQVLEDLWQGMAEYEPSIMKLRRRCGLDNSAKAHRPLATRTRRARATITSAPPRPSANSQQPGEAGKQGRSKSRLSKQAAHTKQQRKQPQMPMGVAKMEKRGKAEQGRVLKGGEVVQAGTQAEQGKGRTGRQVGKRKREESMGVRQGSREGKAQGRRTRVSKARGMPAPAAPTMRHRARIAINPASAAQLSMDLDSDLDEQEASPGGGAQGQVAAPIVRRGRGAGSVRVGSGPRALQHCSVQGALTKAGLRGVCKPSTAPAAKAGATGVDRGGRGSVAAAAGRVTRQGQQQQQKKKQQEEGGRGGGRSKMKQERMPPAASRQGRQLRRQLQKQRQESEEESAQEDEGVHVAVTVLQEQEGKLQGKEVLGRPRRRQQRAAGTGGADLMEEHEGVQGPGHQAMPEHVGRQRGVRGSGLLSVLEHVGRQWGLRGRRQEFALEHVGKQAGLRGQGCASVPEGVGKQRGERDERAAKRARKVDAAEETEADQVELDTDGGSRLSAPNGERGRGRGRGEKCTQREVREDVEGGGEKMEVEVQRRIQGKGRMEPQVETRGRGGAEMRRRRRCTGAAASDSEVGRQASRGDGAQGARRRHVALGDEALGPTSSSEHVSPPKDVVLGKQGGRGNTAKQQQRQRQQQQQQIGEDGGELQGRGALQPADASSDSEPTSADSVLPRPPSPPSVCARRRGSRRAPPGLPIAGGVRRGVARGGGREDDPDIGGAAAYPAFVGIPCPSSSQNGDNRAVAGLVVQQAGPSSTPMAYLPLPGSLPLASTAAGTLGSGAANLPRAVQPRTFAKSPLGQQPRPAGPARPFAHPSTMLPPRLGASAGNGSGCGNSGFYIGGGAPYSNGAALDNSGGSGVNTSGGRSGGSVHSVMGSTHGMKTAATAEGQLVPPPTMQVPHHVATGGCRPPVVPGSRGEIMQRSLRGRQGTMLLDDEQGGTLYPPGAMAGNMGTPATQGAQGRGCRPGNENNAAALLMPPPKRSGPGSMGCNSGGVGAGHSSGNAHARGQHGLGEANMHGNGVTGVLGSAQVPDVCLSTTGGVGKQQSQGVTSTPRLLRLLNA